MSFRLYFRPWNGGGTTYKLDAPAGVVLRVLDPDERRRDVELLMAGEGQVVSSWAVQSSLELVISWSRDRSTDVRDWHHRLAQVLEFLDQGGSIGIARNAAKAGLFPLTNEAGDALRGGVSDGVSTIWLGNDFLSWETSPTLSANDDVVVETEAPEGSRWLARVTSSTAGPPLTLESATECMGDLNNEAWCRHRDFWPYLTRADPGVPALIQEDQGELFTLTLRMLHILPTVSLP